MLAGKEVALLQQKDHQIHTFGLAVKIIPSIRTCVMNQILINLLKLWSEGSHTSFLHLMKDWNRCFYTSHLFFCAVFHLFPIWSIIPFTGQFIVRQTKTSRRNRFNHQNHMFKQNGEAWKKNKIIKAWSVMKPSSKTLLWNHGGVFRPSPEGSNPAEFSIQPGKQPFHLGSHHSGFWVVGQKTWLNWCPQDWVWKPWPQKSKNHV